MLLKLTPQIWKQIVSKTGHRGLIPKYDGPFEVVKRVSEVAYRLKLPEKLKIHPVPCLRCVVAMACGIFQG